MSNKENEYLLMKNRANDLRNNMTKEEKKLWYDFLKNHELRFMRQKVIENYIVDFYCHRASLIIEVDGIQHYKEKGFKYDEKRTKRLNELGFYVLRVTNYQIKTNFYGVCNYINNVIRDCLKEKDS